MKSIRIIPRLDIKGENVVKGINLEGIRVVGNPTELAKKYYQQGADEILYMDVVASLYERNNLKHIVEKTTANGIFIPVTVGGGIRTIENIKEILRAGADKVAINTAATKNPNFIKEAARIFGSQCIIGSIEAKKIQNNKWEAYIDNGREATSLDVIKWAKELVNLGAGELLITSIDQEGTEKGLDLELIKQISSQVSVPVIACGGTGNVEDIQKCFQETSCDALAIASILHYNKNDINEIKESLLKNNLPVRKVKEMKIELQNKTNKKQVSIIDYGAGNLKSVIRAFQTCGNEVKLVETADEVLNSELLVLPGDGAFGYGMNNLTKKELVEPIKQYINTGKPFLGICLGMQLLMTKSLEFGEFAGLNVIKGKVIPFQDAAKINQKRYSIPHMGWNNIINNNSNGSSIFSGLPVNSEFYFVHSFHIVPENTNYSVSEVEYGGQKFCAILNKENVYATQFHPEKSGMMGMKIVTEFSEL